MLVALMVHLHVSAVMLRVFASVFLYTSLGAHLAIARQFTVTAKIEMLLGSRKLSLAGTASLVPLGCAIKGAISLPPLCLCVTEHASGFMPVPESFVPEKQGNRPLFATFPAFFTRYWFVDHRSLALK
jgi:hypothetical protein